MAEAVYFLCFLTSAAVATLLFRAYFRSRQRVVLWSGIGFVGLCANNLLLVLDLVVVPHIDLSLARLLAAVAGMTVMTAGLLLDSD
ncbi:MAG TPA: DUF5985 family protein [Phycisphaerales bacterium]|nr:DUF5985 family protein [Phycisphaerales bacterium]